MRGSRRRCRPWIAVGLVLPAIVVLACASRPETTMNQKIDPELLHAFEQDADAVHGVVVVFTKMPDERVLDEMSLAPVPPNEATGQLTRQQIETLAKRADVSRIRSRPRPQAH